MRLHTSLTYDGIKTALLAAKRAGKITNDVVFMVRDEYSSRDHDRSFEIQLGTYDKNSLPPGYRDQHGKLMRVRRYKNSGKRGASSGWDAVWAATYSEWGWFIAEVFKLDPHARFGPKPKPGSHGYGIYDGPDDFNMKTDNRFKDSH